MTYRKGFFGKVFDIVEAEAERKKLAAAVPDALAGPVDAPEPMPPAPKPGPPPVKPPLMPSPRKPEARSMPPVERSSKYFASPDYHYPDGYGADDASGMSDPTTSTPETSLSAPPKPETPQEKEDREKYEQVKKKFDENEKKIFEARHKSKGRLKIIFEALGIRKRSVEDEEIKGYLESRKTLHPELMAAGRQALSGNEQEWKEFETNYHETVIAIRSRIEEDGIRAKEAQYGNAFVGLANVSKNYREFISKQFLTDGKLTVKGFAKGMATAAAIGFAATSLIAASLPALGVVAVGSAGASAAMIWRGFSSVGAGYALKKRMEKGFVEKKEKEVQADVLKIIEAKKQKTDEEWKDFIKKREGITSITGEEQAFANADAKHKRLALGLAGGIFGAGTLVSYFAADIRGFFGQAWDKVTHSFGSGKTGFYDAAHSPITDAETLAGAGKGAAIPEKMPGKAGFSEALEIKKNHSSMGVLRRFALSKFEMITGDGHYNPNDALVNDYYQNMKFHHKLPSGLANFDNVRSMPKNIQQEFFKFCDSRMNDYFHGLKRTIIENMRHNPKYYNSLSSEMKQLADSINNYGDYRNLPPGLKKVVFADREAANWILDKYHSFQEVPRIRAGQMLNINQEVSGKIFLGDTSGLKTGSLHHDIPQGKGGGTYEPSGRKPAWLEALDEKQRAAQAKFAEAASASDKTHAALVQSRGQLAAASVAESAAISNTQTHQLMDFIQSKIYGSGTGVDWHERAADFRKRMLGSFLTSDQPMGPPVNAGEQQQFWNIAKEINNKLGATVGNENVEEWVQRGLAQKRVSPEDIIRTFSRAANG